jgi:hypothetical protein
LHEFQVCKQQFKHCVEAIKDKILIDIMKIKNPNETLYKLMKVFFSLLNGSSNNLSWIFLQAHLSNFNNIKNDLENLLNLDIKKETIDECMNFNIHYNEIKSSLLKINKNLIIILDLIKCAVDCSVKKGLVTSLVNTNSSVLFYITI